MRVARPIAEKSHAGFTLIELLVVLLVIAILAGLSFAVLGRTGTTARISATRTTLQQLDSLISERLEAFRRHDFRNQANLLKLAYDAAGNTPSVVPFQAAERMVRKNAYRATFPSRFEDLFGFDGMDGDAAGSFSRDAGTRQVTLSDFANYGDPGSDDAPLAALIRNLIDNPQPGVGSFFNPDVHDPDTESSELLYLALTRGTTYGAPLDSLDGIDADRLQDTDEDGLIEILDDWGNPIRFYNWPTSLMRAGADGEVFDRSAAAALVFDAPAVPPVPNGNAMFWTETTDYTHPLKQDPDDPFGELPIFFSSYDLDFGSGASTMMPFGQTDPADITTDAQFYHGNNIWHAPLLVSAGPNAELGLGEPNSTGFDRLAIADLNADGVIDSDEIDALGDNITNRQQAGGN